MTDDILPHYPEDECSLCVIDTEPTIFDEEHEAMWRDEGIGDA